MTPYRRALEVDFERSRREHPDWPVVLSEGDSWFSYSDVIGRLDDPRNLGDPRFQRPWCLLRLEKAGDEVMTILSGAQRAKLRARLSRGRIDALLFSAGGNDLIGPDLPGLLRRWKGGMSAADAVAFSRFERRLRQIADCYRELLDLLADCGQDEAKVLVNSYDYAVPSDRPVRLLWGALTVAGPWMKPAFDEAKIPPRARGEVVRLLIDAFAAAIDAVAAESRGAGHLVRVETRGAVGSDWRDEIHPSRRGARRVASAFEFALREHGVLPAPA